MDGNLFFTEGITEGIDKNSLFDGVSIGRFLLCVKQEMVTIYRDVPGVKLSEVLVGITG